MRTIALSAIAAWAILAAACSDADAPSEQPQSQTEPQPTAVEQNQPEQSESPQQSLVDLGEPPFDIETAIDHVEHLANELGPRASGTDEEREAAHYLRDTFEELGYEVELQEFSYTFTPYTTAIDTAESPVYAFRFRASAPHEAAGELVEVPNLGEADDFDAVDVEGKIAIVSRGVLYLVDKARNAQDAGAAALIIANRSLDETISGSLGNTSIDIPVLLVSQEDGDTLRDLIGETIAIPEQRVFERESQNVIARRPGGQCLVVVGGHYDTVPNVDGANDNASGAALTLALADAWAEHPAASDICFVGFGAEEDGLNGSRIFVRRLSEDALAQVDSMLNLDVIGDGYPPYRLIASTALRELTDAAAQALKIDAATGFLPEEIGSDHLNFVSEGIPAIFVFPPGAVIHVPQDNFANFNREVFTDIAELNHAILACLLERAGSLVVPSNPCGHATLGQ